MKNVLGGVFCLLVLTADGAPGPLINDSLVFEERDGLVAVEAEHFFKQEKDKVRAWHITHRDAIPDLKPDADPAHLEDASGGAYLEILPDTRRNHGEKLINGENFINTPGQMAVLSYKVHFNTPGRYYVWARIFSTGTEDNGCHVGLNGTWPASGQRMQWTGKKKWVWGSKQRTEKTHGGERYKLFLDVKKSGEQVISFSMREDGFEMDRWLMTTDRDYTPEGHGPATKVKRGKLPKAFVASKVSAPLEKAKTVAATGPAGMPAVSFPVEGSGYYIDKDRWLAIHPEQRKEAHATAVFPYDAGLYHLTLHTVGENDGQSKYEVLINGKSVGRFASPLSKKMYEEGPGYNYTWKNVPIGKNAKITVHSAVGSVDGEAFSRARWSFLEVAAVDGRKLAPAVMPVAPSKPSPAKSHAMSPADVPAKALEGPRKPNGRGAVVISGRLRAWHPVTLSLDGPYAHEKDSQPNPFTDYRMTVRFTHESGTPQYSVPGYFAADGKAGETSAQSGTQWRAHLSPDKPGKWSYEIAFARGPGIALSRELGERVPLHHGGTGTFTVLPSDKSGRDLRGQGRLQYVGKRYLQFAESGQYFLKAGADAPETLLGYADFDGTTVSTLKVPLKHYKSHVRDWQTGDPSWKGGKGKGLIGAVNYLSGTGCNAFSFLTYNAGGDGDNVWPFISRNAKMHYDCSKLDQWRVVFEHAQAKGMYLHFKMQETENDDHRKGKGGGRVPESLDGGALGLERKLYCRELVARYGHLLALNWNLGEENTQTTEEQRAMANYIHALDPYDHHIVVHTYPSQQDAVYGPLLGKGSVLTGASLQNSNIMDTHVQTVKWVKTAEAAGKPWIIAFDESGSAAHGQAPDLGYRGFDGRDSSGKMIYTEHEVRRYTLWGTLMAGGAGVEYYFGYTFAENDLVCEDWRSRHNSWRYCDIALSFFRDHHVPFWEMQPADALVGNTAHDNSRYAMAKPGEIYLVYLPNGGEATIDLSKDPQAYSVQWFNPRKGGALQAGTVKQVTGGAAVKTGRPPAVAAEDWLVVLRRR